MTTSSRLLGETPGSNQLGESAPASAISGQVIILDEQTLRAESLAYALNVAGASVATIGDTNDVGVVRIIEGIRPHVVICSITWPSATRVVRHLTANDVTVLALGDAPNPQLVGEFIEAGASGVVNTCEPVRELLRAVRDTVAGRRVLSVADQRALLGDLAMQRRSEAASFVPFRRLSRRESEVLWALMAGTTPTAIAAERALSIATIRSQIKGLQRKLGVTSQVAAVAKAYQAGWTIQSIGTSDSK